MRRCLIVFAREPQKGKVKTRLRTCLSEPQCLDLYRAFLKDTISLTKNIQCESRILAYESNSKNPNYLRKIARNFKLYRQRGRDLGRRMYEAYKFAKSKKASKVVIIGSDSPTLPPSYIREAFKRLDRNDVVIGPSHDGGYYLIGLKEPCFGIFKDIKWSSNKVLKDTVKKAKDLKKRVAMLKRWYDVDGPVALNYLRRDLKKKKDIKIAKWTKRYLINSFLTNDTNMVSFYSRAEE